MLLVIVAGCDDQQSTPQEEFIKVGVVGPLTGEAASFGESMMAGVTLAANEINAAGGINGKKIKIYAEDTKCSSKSVSSTRKLVTLDKIDVLLGPACSSAAEPMLPILVENNVPTIIVTASAAHLTDMGDNIFRVYPSDSLQGKEAADFVYSFIGEKAAIISVENSWGEGLHKVFKEEFEGEIVYESRVPPDEADFKTELAKVINSEADVLYLPVYPSNAVAAFKQIEELGLDIPIVGGDIFDAEEVVTSGYGDGVVYTMAKIDSSEEFKSRLRTVKGYENLQPVFSGPTGYDAMYVMASAIGKAGLDKDAIIDALYETDYEGVSNSVITFDSQGDLEEVEFEYFEIKNKEAVPFMG